MSRVTAEELTILQAAALLSGATEWDSRTLPGEDIPSFVMSDGPHGVRRQLGSGDHLGIAQSEPATCFPTAATVANSWDPSLVEKMGRALGQEARDLGVDVLLGPGLNIKRHPCAGRNFEYYSEDPLLSGRMAAALIRGIQSQGVAATPKHFAVNSQEERRMVVDSVMDQRTLRELYLTGFEIAVKEGKPRALMTAYNPVNGVYAHENRHLLVDILRDEWGFDGMVVSDWGGSNSAIEAARNGGSLEMPGPGWEGARLIAQAVERGEISAEDVRSRANEVLTMAYDAAQFRSAEPTPWTSEEHHALARKIAEESMVLLKNEASLLPLSAGTRVALIGDFAANPRYQGAGSSLIRPTELETLCEAVEESDLHLIGYGAGFTRQDSDDFELAQDALQLAAQADVVLLALGLDELAESEGQDRQHMQLAHNQVRLLEEIHRVNPRIVVLLSAGAPVETAWTQHCQALLHCYLSGQAGAQAAVNILRGFVNPCGKLAESYAHHIADIPSSADFPSPSNVAVYRESLYVGYRYFSSVEKSVAFPFGYGLSYSSFEYSDLEVNHEGVAFSVRNTSQIDGHEISQIYVTRPGGVWGPRIELKGFAKTHIPAGESVRVSIPFDEYTFRHFDVDSGQWQVEAGTWTVHVGASSAELAMSASYECEGVACSLPQDPRLAPYISGQVDQVRDENIEVLLGREVPAPRYVIGGKERITFGMNDPLCAMTNAHSPLARFAARVLESRRLKAQASGHPDLNILFMQNMPVRAMTKMTRGAINIGVARGVLSIINGHPIRGTLQAIREALANRQHEKAIPRLLERQARERRNNPHDSEGDK